MKMSATQITVPMLEIQNGAYLPQLVQVQLNEEQASTFRRMWRGLDDAGERLKNGRRLASNADVIRWLLEQAAEKYIADMTP